MGAKQDIRGVDVWKSKGLFKGVAVVMQMPELLFLYLSLMITRGIQCWFHMRSSLLTENNLIGTALALLLVAPPADGTLQVYCF